MTPDERAPTDRNGDPPVEIHDLPPEQLPEAIAVIARGMRDNPLHVAAYGSDPERRLRCHATLVGGLFTVVTTQRPIFATRDGRVLGVTGVAPPGTCQPTVAQRMRLLPRLLRFGPATAARVVRWLTEWGRHDPDEPHVHLGPLAVDADLQGKGIGSTILQEHCRRLDADGAVGYLETDKPENVRLYERFGYAVVGEAPVLGVPNWFMRRPAASG